MKRIKYAVMLLWCCFGAFAFAEQYAADYTYAKRYDISGRVVGTIAPDSDGKSPFEYLATRNTYNSRSLLEKVESGVLTSFPSEAVLVENWKDYGFTGTKITQTITYEYDEYGRTIKTTLLDNAGTAKNLTQVNYNTEGNIYCKARRLNPNVYNALPSACIQSTPGNDGPDRISKFTYNEFDQVLAEMRGVDTPLVQTYVTNTYLPTTRVLLTQTDASGNVTTLAYDNWARLTKRTYPSKVVPGRSNDDDYNEYKYDPNGNVRYERKRNGAEINFIYDNNNRLSVKDYVVNTNQKDVYYDYDLRGLQTRAAFGTSVATAASVTADRNEQQYDGFGNVKKDLTSIDGVGRAVYGKYDLDNNRVKVTHDDNNYFTYQFDMLDRLGVIFENAGTRMLQIDYQQDGHRKRIYRRSGVSSTNYFYTNGIQLDSFTQDFKNDSYDLTNSFKYNAANQISELTLGNNLYYYKGNENRTGAYTVNGLNQYTYVGGATQGTGQPMGHDLNSNLVNDGSLIYKYDDENRLIETSGSAASKFIYDPRGRLFESTINGTKTQFLYDGSALVAEYDGSGAMQRRYVHGDQTDEPLVQYNGNTFGNSAAWRYLHADHQGSIIAQSDVNGNVFSTLSYDTYGIPRTTSIDNSDRFGYTGQIWFKDLGLWYYKARVYHPKLGRFLQTDPIGYKDNMNLYAYVGNDPVNRSDPTGLYTCNKGAEAQCDVVDAGLKAAAASMKNMSKADAAKVGGILKTWGTRGQSNHISVASGQVRGAASTSTKNGETTVTIHSGLTDNKGKFEASTQHSMASVVIHEGQHIIDERNWGGRDPDTKQESYDTERRGIGVEDIVEKAEGFIAGPSIYRAVEPDLAKRAWAAYRTDLPGPDPKAW